MAYKKVGLTAIMDVAGFMPNATKFISTVKEMNQVVKNTTEGMTTLKAPATLATNAFAGLAMVAGGIIASNVFGAIADGIKNVAKEAVKAAADFQLLEQRFITLEARDYMRGMNVGLDEAMEKTRGLADANLEWVRTMAVTTPYTVRSLTDLMAYAQAAGFTKNEIMGLGEEQYGLVQSIGDFSAGMGLQSEHIQRIVWNFAQMKSAGRVLGRELRDLGNSMVPVADIVRQLADDFDVTREAATEMLQTGAISVDDFMNKFMEIAGTEFAGAMDRLNDTFYTAKENLKDFVGTIIGMDVVQPTLDEIGKVLNKTLQILLGPEAREAAKGFGEALRLSFLSTYDVIANTFIPALQNLFSALGGKIPTLEDFYRAIINVGLGFKYAVRVASQFMDGIAYIIRGIGGLLGRGFGEIANNTQEWGAKIITFLAKGMVMAIVKVVEALGMLARVITGFLRPKSPPKLLPDIDKWGAETMEIYLEGWKAADFSVLNDITGMIEKYLNVFPDLEREDIISRLIGGRAAAIEAVNNLQDVENVALSAMQNITSAAGISNQTMLKYFQSLFKLKEINEQVADATDLLSFSLGKSTVIYGKIVTSIDEAIAMSEQYKGLASENIKAYLQALKDVSTLEQEASAAQEELNKTTSYYDDLLKSLQAQQNKLNDDLENAGRLRAIDKALKMVILTTEERERLELEKRGILLAREIRDTKLAQDAAEEEGEAKVDATKAALDAAENMAKVQKDLAESILKSTQDQVEGQVKAYEELMNMMLKQMELEKELAKAREEKAGKGGETPLEDAMPDAYIPDLGGAIGDLGIEDTIGGIFEELEKQWDEAFAELMLELDPLKTAVKNLQTDFENLGTAISEAFTTPEGIAKLKTTLLGLTIAGIATAIGINTFKTIAIPAIVRFITLTVPTYAWYVVASLTAAFGTIPVIIGAAILAAFILFGPEIIAWLDQAGKDINQWIADRLLDFGNWGTEQKALMEESLSGLTTWVTNMSAETDKAIQNAIKSVGDWMNQAVVDIDRFFSDIWTDITNWFTTALADTANWLDEAWTNVLEWIGTAIEDIGTWLEDMWKEIGTWLEDLATDLLEGFEDAWSGVTKWFDTAIGDMLNFGGNLIQGIIDGVGNMADSLWRAVRGVVTNALTGAQQATDTNSPSKKFALLGKNWMLGLAMGITQNAGLVTGAMSSIIGASGLAYSGMGAMRNSSYSSALPTASSTYNQYINMNMNPTYQNVQSPSSIYYDMTAALASIRR